MDCRWSELIPSFDDGEPEIRLEDLEDIVDVSTIVKAIEQGSCDGIGSSQGAEYGGSQGVDWDRLQIVDRAGEEGDGAVQLIDEDQLFTELGLRTEDDDHERAGEAEAAVERENLPGNRNVETAIDTTGAAIPVDDDVPGERLWVYDPNKPCMDIGTVYPTMKEFRVAMIQFAINEEFELHLVKTDPSRYIGECNAEGCPWHINGRTQPDGCTVKVTALIDLHNCTSTARRRTTTPTSAWVASKAIHHLKKAPTMGTKDMQTRLQDEHKCEIHYDTVWKGMQMAQAELFGTWQQSFQMLFNWRAEVLKRSPGSVLAVSTDACKGLEKAVKVVFPQAEHRECFRHLMQNFIKKFGGDVFSKMYPAARTYRKEVFKYFFNQIVAASPEIMEWLQTHHKLLWMRSAFNPEIKCDYVTNNLAECFNNWIKDWEDLPIVELADKVREKIMILWNKRRAISENLEGKILPAVLHQLRARTRGLANLTVVKSGPFAAEVHDTTTTRNRHVVKSYCHECTCLQWQHTGKPCQHALALITAQQSSDVKMEDFVHDYYSVQRFRDAYKRFIEPMPDKTQWPQVELDFTVLAPLGKRGRGQPRKLRIKGCLEGGSGGKTQKQAKEATNQADKDAELEAEEAAKGKRQLITGKRRCKGCGELGHGQTSYKCPLRNAELIRQTFAGIDADAILSTPLRGIGEDCWGWRLEKHGCYSVRSAYRLLYDEEWQRTEKEQATSSENKTWKRLWRLCVPPKVRVFWWRVVNGFMPTKGILHRRHIEPTPHCEACGDREETIMHVLMECTVARCFWEQVRSVTGYKLPRLHQETWAQDLVDPSICSDKAAAVFLCGMWSLWTTRNKKRHGEPEIPMSRAVQWAIDIAADLWHISHPAKAECAQEASRQWTRPTVGWIKCNVDASFLAEDRRGATGVVLRNHDGQSCGGRARWYDHCLTALVTEAMACRDGIIFALERNVQRLVLETDCQTLVNLWKQSSRKNSEVGPLLQQIEDLSRSFIEFSFVFSNRDCNRLAHECAKLVSRNMVVEEWLEPPLGLRDIIANDCKHVHDE